MSNGPDANFTQEELDQRDLQKEKKEVSHKEVISAIVTGCHLIIVLCVILSLLITIFSDLGVITKLIIFTAIALSALCVIFITTLMRCR